MTRGVIVVAHPDDDALFATPIQATMTDVDWRLICVTYDRDHPRAAELLAWQSRMGCHHVEFLGFPDTAGELESGESSVGCEDIAAKVRPLLKSADIVVTHNDIGEYGHPRHGAVHRAVNMIDVGPKAIYFAHGYRRCDLAVPVQPFVQEACACFPSQAQTIRRLHRRYGCCRVGCYFRRRIPEDAWRWVALPAGQSKSRCVRFLHLLLQRERPRCR